jgi:Domain of unknown function (DUF4865)
MYAMQYEIVLPADYDMGVIRHRVATRGTSLDAFPGLGLKAYLIRERGAAGSSVNAYAPFYLWTAISGMSRFLWGGGGFAGLADSFGRPTVRHWIGVAFGQGPSVAATPKLATRYTKMLLPDSDLAAMVASARDELEQRACLPGIHSTALAIDPHHWELVHFTLWKDDAPENTGTSYQVLHLSRPHLSELQESNH